MKRDLGDIIDRASIACLKAERIKEQESIREWEYFKRHVKRHKMFFDLMKSINAMIWDLEADLRQGKLDGVLSEVGRRAIAIREHNNLRVQLKNIINSIHKDGFLDIKRNHISEG